MILAAEKALGKVIGNHTYVGGACVGFYIDDPAAAEIRPTRDVDIVVEIATEAERVELDQNLRDAGFEPDMVGPMCRHKRGDILVDVMPTNPSDLGSVNSWYPQVLANSHHVSIEGETVRIPDVCTFLATKIETFANRGRGDFIGSQDFEDIARILDGCTTLDADRLIAPGPVLRFLKATFQNWAVNPEFQEGLNAHLDNGGLGRTEIVNKRISLFRDN